MAGAERRLALKNRGPCPGCLWNKSHAIWSASEQENGLLKYAVTGQVLRSWAVKEPPPGPRAALWLPWTPPPAACSLCTKRLMTHGPTQHATASNSSPKNRAHAPACCNLKRDGPNVTGRQWLAKLRTQASWLLDRTSSRRSLRCPCAGGFAEPCDVLRKATIRTTTLHQLRKTIFSWQLGSVDGCEITVWPACTVRRRKGTLQVQPKVDAMQPRDS